MRINVHQSHVTHTQMEHLLIKIRHMKKLFLFVIPLILVLVSCSKSNLQQPPVDESEWLQKPRGRVIESDFGCSYFMVENAMGYSVLRMFGGSVPFPGSVIYGYHDDWGMRTFYNRSAGYLFNAQVLDYGLSYFAALDVLQWNCHDF